MGRRVLFHLTVALVTVPFVLAWWWGFNALMERAASSQLQTLGTLLRLPSVAFGLPFIATWVAGPIALRILRFPATPNLVPFDPKAHPLPSEAARWLDENVAFLRLEGFDLLASFVQQRDDLTIHQRLLEHREAKTTARLEWSTHWSLSTLRTVTSRGIRLTATASGLCNTLPLPPSHVYELLPGLTAQNLAAAHRALVADDGGALEGGYREGEPSVSSAPLEWLRAVETAKAEAYVSMGVFTPPRRDGAHRVRWRTAAITQWKQLWPFYGHLVRARRRRARQLLDAHGLSFPIVERKHAKGAYSRMIAGPAGGLSATALVAFTTYALLFVPAGSRRAHEASKAEHPCPCTLAAEVERATLAQFDSPAAASAAARALGQDSSQLTKLPDALVFEHASAAQLASLRAKGAAVLPDGASARFAVSCTATDNHAAREMERDLRDYMELQYSWVDVSPWLAPPTPEQVRARRTLRLLLAGLESSASPSELDEAVLRAWTARPDGEDDEDDGEHGATAEWRKQIRPLLGGQSPVRGEYRHAAVELHGKNVSVTGGTEHAARETMALARYLCAKGCQDVRFSAKETFVPGP